MADSRQLSVMDPSYREESQSGAAARGALRSLIEGVLGPIDSLGALYRGGQPSGAVERLVEALGVGKPAANAPVAVQKAADAGEAASPALPFVPKAAKGLVNAMVAAPRAGSRAGQIGAIRVGGAPDLYATHSVAPSSLFSYNEKRVPGGRAWQKELAGTLELSNPSIAIRSDTLSNPFGHDLRLIPRQGAFDPATSASTLFNRDAYTPRARDYEGSIAAADFNKRVAGNGEVRPVDRFAAKHRLVERLFMDPAALHGTERLPDAVIDDNVRAIFDGRVTRSLGHDTAIAASPSFRSFRDFERSRAGAATLRKEGDYDEYWREALQDPLKGPINTQLNEVMGKLYRRHYPNDAFPDDTELREAIIRFHAQPKALREDPEKAREWLENYISNNMGTAVNPGQLAARIDGPFGQVFASGVRRQMAEAPSQYAELKIHGTTPVTGENWAAALFGDRQSQWSDVGRKLAQRFHRAGIEVVDDANSFSGDAEKRLVDAIHQEVGPARKFPIRDFNR